MPLTRHPDLLNSGSVRSKNLDGWGFIAQESVIEANPQLETLDQLRNDLIDYIRLRLGDQIVDVELDKEHYDLAIKQALSKYRQRSQNSVEESYVFLDLQPETQEYILPDYIQEVRKIFRRGIGSVSGTTASQFEPFASGYLNTYMLVAGRVGGLVNYELFTQYQELAMKMFGGYMNFTWNRVTKKLTLMRKLPYQRFTPLTVVGAVADDTDTGSTITLQLEGIQPLAVGDELWIRNTHINGVAREGWNQKYPIVAVTEDQGVQQTLVQVIAQANLEFAQVPQAELELIKCHSPQIDGATESVLLWCYNHKPDSYLLSDPLVLPWIQEYALAFAKSILGQARGKFGSVAGPQGGNQLNGAALLQEAQAEMEKLEEDLRRYIDGGAPLAWITG